MTEPLLLDDFRREDGTSTLGTRWEGLTDRVMGGRSDMQVGHRDTDDGRVLYLRGQVRLENRGGFIQARLPLCADGGSLDASGWQGIRIKLRGRPGPYYLHLKTRQTWQPWQHFRAPVEVEAEWQERFVPFSAFEGRATWQTLDPGGLKSIGVVAYGEAFLAEIEVARLELWPGSPRRGEGGGPGACGLLEDAGRRTDHAARRKPRCSTKGSKSRSE